MHSILAFSRFIFGVSGKVNFLINSCIFTWFPPPSSFFFTYFVFFFVLRAASIVYFYISRFANIFAISFSFFIYAGTVFRYLGAFYSLLYKCFTLIPSILFYLFNFYYSSSLLRIFSDNSSSILSIFLFKPTWKLRYFYESNRLLFASNRYTISRHG